MRLFLRYLIVDCRCDPDLLSAIPTIPNWRLAALPRPLPAKDVKKIIAMTNGRTERAMRDRAVLLLLAGLGLRAGDVAGLRLGDIDWTSGRLRVAGKGRRESWLPLPQEIGDAILAYLKIRPASREDHVLLRTTAPVGRMSRTGVGFIVRRALRRAGIRVKPGGAHVLRHYAEHRIMPTRHEVGRSASSESMTTAALSDAA